MIYNMKRPSAQQLEPMDKVINRLKSFDESVYMNDKDKAARSKLSDVRRTHEHTDYLKSYNYENDHVGIDRRANFLQEVKKSFLTAALYKVLKESLSCHITSADEKLMKTLVSNFVHEQGAGNLLTRFKYQNTTLAEIGRVVRESYQRVVNSLNEIAGDKSSPSNVEKPDGSPNITPKNDLKLNKDIVDQFYTDMVDVDTSTATQMIRDKVSDSMNDFIDDVGRNAEDIRDVIERTKATADKYQNINSGSDEVSSGNSDLESSKDSTTPAESTEEDTEASETGSTDEAAKDSPSFNATKPEGPEPPKQVPTSQVMPMTTDKPNAKGTSKPDDSKNESTIDRLNRDAKRKILELQHVRPKSPFHYMVEAVTKETLRDDALRSRYVHESKVDMDGILHNVEIMYTMLEMVNTLEIVNEQYVKDYITSLVNFK